MSSERIITERTTKGMRDALFSEFDKLRNGETSPARANAVARTASEIISTVKLEMEYIRLQGNMDMKPDGILPGKIHL